MTSKKDSKNMKKNLKLGRPRQQRPLGRPAHTTNAIMTEATRKLIYGNMKPPNDIKIISEAQMEENYKNQRYYDLREDQ